MLDVFLASALLLGELEGDDLKGYGLHLSVVGRKAMSAIYVCQRVIATISLLIFVVIYATIKE